MPRLSTLVDRSLFVADNGGLKSPSCSSFGVKDKVDELTESPHYIETYPPRTSRKVSIVLDSPARRHVEGVYDRYVDSYHFLRCSFSRKRQIPDVHDWGETCRARIPVRQRHSRISDTSTQVFDEAQPSLFLVDPQAYASACVERGPTQSCFRR